MCAVTGCYYVPSPPALCHMLCTHRTVGQYKYFYQGNITSRSDWSVCYQGNIMSRSDWSVRHNLLLGSLQFCSLLPGRAGHTLPMCGIYSACFVKPYCFLGFTQFCWERPILYLRTLTVNRNQYNGQYHILHLKSYLVLQLQCSDKGMTDEDNAKGSNQDSVLVQYYIQ